MNRYAGSQPVEAFEPRESIWAYIEGQTIEEERVEIKKLIGSSLIEETVDLHLEVKSLLEIWRDYRQEADSQSQYAALPEPPNVRENLVKQIQLFLKLLQEKSERSNRDYTRSLSPFQSEVVKNIHENGGRPNSAQQRPQTAQSSRDGRQTPVRPQFRDSVSSCSSRLADHFTDQPKSSSDIETLADLIRESLEEERNGLHTDIQFLQQCLLDESTFQASSYSRHEEPSLKDLQEIGLRLEKELLVIGPASSDRSSPKPDPGKDSHEKKWSNAAQKPQSGHAVPSPPTSAPTSRNRSNNIRRKQLAGKSISFPGEEGMKSNFGHQVRPSVLKRNEKSQDHKIWTDVSTKNRSGSATGVAKPCVTNPVGSNSQKLRQLVLDCRESQS